MEILPIHSTGPTWEEGPDAKQTLQSKQQHRKSKSKHTRQALPEEQRIVSSQPAVCAQENAGVSVISALQEFVQDSKAYRMPSRHSILQWHFEERCVNTMAMQFRAVAAFVLDGVPHQVAGDWQSSKNLAKRDAAERALGLFVGMWGCLLQEEQNSKLLDSCSLPQNRGKNQADVDTLMNFCSTFPACCQILPEVTASWENGSCKGLVEINMFGVPHTFAGSECKDKDTALSDVARRVLWYLQCPGFDNAFDVDMDALASRSQDFATPPSFWQVDGDP